MNKMMIAFAVIVAFVLIDFGLGLRSRIDDTRLQENDVARQNKELSDELALKQSMKKTQPKSISSAFTFFVNEVKMFETYSGTRMNLFFSNSKNTEGIDESLVDTMFRKVKGLAITINVEKFSNQTDMAEVLNDITLLEKRTDFKVSSIESENNELIVKGELYGIE